MLHQVGELEAEEPQHQDEHARLRAQLEALAAAAPPTDEGAQLEALVAAAFPPEEGAHERGRGRGGRRVRFEDARSAEELAHGRAASLHETPAGEIAHGRAASLHRLAGVGRLRPAPVGLGSANRAGLGVAAADMQGLLSAIRAAGFPISAPMHHPTYAGGFVAGLRVNMTLRR